MINKILYSIKKVQFAFCLSKKDKVSKLFFEETGYELTDQCYQQNADLLDQLSDKFYAEPGFSIFNDPHPEVDIEEDIQYNFEDEANVEELEPITERREILKKATEISRMYHLKMVA